MEYKEFVNQVLEEVRSRMPLCGVELTKVKKNNGIILDGISIKHGDSVISPVFYLNCRYTDEYQKGKSVSQIAEGICSGYEKIRDSNEIDAQDISAFWEFDKAKERIVYRIINKEKNKDILKEIPHMDFVGDITVVFAYLVEAKEQRGATITVHNRIMELWGTDVKELYRLAGINTPRIMGWNLRSMSDVIAGFGGCGDGAVTVQDREDVDGGMSMYVLTNTCSLHGAACILYPGLLKSIGEKLGDDYYIIPSSLHETLILPLAYSCSPDQLADMIRTVNATQVEDEDVLSDSPYFYSRDKGTLIAA